MPQRRARLNANGHKQPKPLSLLAQLKLSALARSLARGLANVESALLRPPSVLEVSTSSSTATLTKRASVILPKLLSEAWLRIVSPTALARSLEAAVATAVLDPLTASLQVVPDCALVPAASLIGSEVAHSPEAVLEALMARKVEDMVD